MEPFRLTSIFACIALAPSFAAAQNVPDLRLLQDAQALCQTCIEISERIRLGEVDGPGYLDGGSLAAVDQLGRYWVVQRGGPKLFDHRGNFLGQIGRLGAGPGEFGTIGWLLVDRTGVVRVYDNRHLRETAFSADLVLQGTRRIPGLILDAVPLDQEHLVVNMILPSGGSFGVPIHVLRTRDLSVVHSFGASERGGPTRSYHRIGVDSAGTIYSVERSRFALSVWSPEGKQLKNLVRRDVFANIPADRRTSAKPDGIITDIHIGAGGLVWIAYWVPRSDWNGRVTWGRDGSGKVRYQRDEPSDIYEGYIDVVDIDREVVLARTNTGDRLIYGFFDTGAAYGRVYSVAGAPLLAVWDITLAKGGN